MKEYLEKIIIDKSEADLQTINDKYSRLFYTIVFDVTKDNFFSEETVNDILFYIWNKAKFLATLEYPEAYLCTICYNKGLDYLRKNKRIIYNNELIFSKSDTSINDKSLVDSVLSKLGTEERSIIIMKLAYNMTYEEIAKVLKLTIKKVRLRFIKAQDRIKNIIKEDNVYER